MSQKPSSPGALPLGLYERVLDQELVRLLAALEAPRVAQTGPLDAGESHTVLAQHLGGVLQRTLNGFTGPERLHRQIELCNRVVQLLGEYAPPDDTGGKFLSEEARRLLAIYEPPFTVDKLPPPPGRPETPLAISSLLTGARLDPSLVSQLRRELDSVDRVDILCSFIKWSGIRVIEEELREFTKKPDTRLRIITTSYMGATDPRAVEFLSQLPRTELKISYDTRRTRLHAKAYLFHRDTAFGTAYVGSSNLSNAALTDGLEWNVKLSQHESPHLWEKLCATFDTYWDDAEFVGYSEHQRERLVLALREERGKSHTPGFGFQFDIRPYHYQQEILDRLAADRTYHHRWRNLVVAATGTGKTVIAAFDYKRFRQQYEKENPGKTPRLLFAAHREEILEQSLDCFRHVLRDPNFGDLLVGQHQPGQLDHLFVSIQSYNSRRLYEKLPANHFDFVVIDECHHGEAASYEPLFRYVEPRVLLGLTATPERGDGKDILHHFGGHISAEIRLPDAINRKLLCPFQYFGVTDSVDLSALQWSRGRYDPEELNRRYTHNDARADLVVRSVREKLVDPRRARGLGFCVSVAHAEYMAEYFHRSGIPAVALSAQSPPELRHTVQQRLKDGQINFIFVVDLYNEGVDIPAVDTLLFLRPTESLTVFLQQFGRGLRLSDDKDCLTVLDFIGQSHRSYNWEVRFRALMDRPRKRVDHEIADGCLHLPLGCFIHLERKAQDYVLQNIRQALAGRATDLVQRIASFQNDTGHPVSLERFLDHYGWEPDELYRRGTWSRLCVRAGVLPEFTSPDETTLTKGLRRFAHVNSPSLIRRLLGLLSETLPPILDPLDERALLMLLVDTWKSWRPASLTEVRDRLHQNPVFRDELRELLAYRFGRLREVPPALELPFPCLLELHSTYTRDEILVGLGCWNLARQPDVREGVYHAKELKTDVFFVTLNKTESDYSPTTLYEDYALSPDRFHWQSQSTTSEVSDTGKRYTHHAEEGGTVLLFVREDKTRNGLACPYHFLGPATYESHTGSKPMSIIWRLQHPIPAHLLPATLRMSAA